MRGKRQAVGAALKKDRSSSGKGSFPTKKSSNVGTSTKRTHEFDKQLTALREREQSSLKRQKAPQEVQLAPSLLLANKGNENSTSSSPQQDPDYFPFQSSEREGNPRVKNVFAALPVEGEEERFRVALRPPTLVSRGFVATPPQGTSE